jgi:hypothetical protein
MNFDDPSTDARRATPAPQASASLRLLLGAAAVLGVNAALAADDSIDAPAADSAGEALGDTRTRYRYSEYDEAPQTGRVVGDRDRYFVRAHQFRLDQGFGDRAALSLSGTQEIMSGSSPWYVLPSPNGPVQVLSGATIRDDRRELVATLVTDPANPDRNTYSASVSDEDDYRSLALGFERAQALSSQLTLGYGFSYSDDRIEPTDALEFDRIAEADKRSASAFASLAWVLDRASVLQAGLQLTRHSGYLSDPYKQVFIVDNVFRDDRPDRRTQTAAVLRYRHAFAAADASLHADYRFVRDDWSVRSHTVELAWYQSLGRDWRLVPSLRYYSQSEADFYGMFFLADPGAHASSDFRLSAFGAVAAKLNLRKRVGDWTVSLGAERYRSDRDYGLGSGDAAPGLLDYTRFFVGFDYGFGE